MTLIQMLIFDHADAGGYCSASPCALPHGRATAFAKSGQRPISFWHGRDSAPQNAVSLWTIGPQSKVKLVNKHGKSARRESSPAGTGSV
jgi:hypothetical protein